MIIFPAIDIKDGVCVRLKKGDYRQITTYENTPIDQAALYFQNGFNKLFGKLFRVFMKIKDFIAYH